MISREVQKIPEDQKELRKFLRKILRDHYEDIKTLFDTCTDFDKFEQQQREQRA